MGGHIDYKQYARDREEVLAYVDKVKFFEMNDVKNREWECDIVKTVHRMNRDMKLISVFVENPVVNGEVCKNKFVYTTVEYADCAEFRNYLKSLDVDDVRMRIIISKAKHSNSDDILDSKRKKRRVDTLNSINLKYDIFKFISNNPNVDYTKLYEEFSLIPSEKIKSAIMGLKNNKCIKYDKKYRTFVAIKEKY